MNAHSFNASQCQCAWFPQTLNLNLENAEFSGATSALHFIEQLLEQTSIDDLAQNFKEFTCYLNELQSKDPKIAQQFYCGFISILKDDLEKSLERDVIPFDDFDLIKAEQYA